MKNWTTSVSFDIKSSVDWVTKSNLYSNQYPRLYARSRGHTINGKSQVDSLGTVLFIQEGLYISQPYLSMCTKDLCMHSLCIGLCTITPFPTNSRELSKGI